MVQRSQQSVKLNLGCGVNLVKGFIHVDKYFSLADLQSKQGIYVNATIEKGAEFVQADICKLPFKDNYADYIECIDVIEHLPIADVQQAVNEMARVLKPGGKLCLATPNFDDLAKRWVKTIVNKPYNEADCYELAQIIYGNQAGEGEYHKNPLNPQIIKHYLQNAGLKFKIFIYPYLSNDRPPIKTQNWPDKPCLRSEIMWVEATK